MADCSYQFGGRVAVVTGGASGIGASLVQALQQAGARAAVWDLQPRQTPGLGGHRHVGDRDTTASASKRAQKSPAVEPGFSVKRCKPVRDQESTQLTMPLKAVTSTMMPNTMRYQANGTKLLEAI